MLKSGHWMLRGSFDEPALAIESFPETAGSIELKMATFSFRKDDGYGLLGASGCGKTTLLSCLVGAKNLDRGKLSVLGTNPYLNGVPSSRLGYMPQDVALAAEFTTLESLLYFGRIYGIKDSAVKERFEKLSELLALPDDNKLIKECSGGEQRRVSFAVALTNNPELLILDEPTVGLDPVLREILWNYLVDLVKERNVAVIITTHYIEEARRAHQVGFMRQGKLLAEDSPEKLLNFYQTNTLEDVFLTLSKKQAEGFDANDNAVRPTYSEPIVSPSFIAKQKNVLSFISTNQIRKKHLRALCLSMNRLRALFGKNLIQISRNLSGTFFTLIFPVISMLALLTAIGDDAKNLNVAIVSSENLPDMCTHLKPVNHNNTECQIDRLTCRFVEELEDPMINKVFLKNIGEALDDLKHGKVWAVLHIPNNFSNAFQEKLETGIRASDDTLNLSQVTAWVDVSNKQIGIAVKHKLSEKILKLQKDILTECKYSPFIDSIVRLQKVLYGDKTDKYTVFVVPGVLLTIIFFVSITNTVDTIITDRLGGIWERSAVAGVSSLEIVLSHFVIQLFIVVIQVIELIILTFFIYKTEYEGTLVEISVILLAGGVSGMFYGFWISVVCKNHSVANFLTTGSFYPLIIISGVIWPLEGMSRVLQYCAFTLPIALPTKSLRSIINRGWNLANLEVLAGLGVQILWITLLGIICVYQLKTKR